MSTLAVSFRDNVLPWSIATADEERYKRVLRTVLAIVILFGLLFRFLNVPPPDRAKPAELPPRIAKLVLENKPVPPPPPPKKEAPIKEERVVKEGVKPEPPRDKTPPKKAERVPEARVPVPNKPPGEALENARKKASGVGLFADNSTSVSVQVPTAVQLNQNIKPGPGVGTGTGVGVGAGNEPGLPDRALITSKAQGGSGGINTAAYSRNTGGGGLAGRGTTLVEGVAGGGGGGGFGGGGSRGGNGDGVGGGGGTKAGGTMQRGNSGKASRSLEDIRLVMERNKGALFAIYQRALRDDPALQGKMVISLKIAPSGQLVDCHLISSELKSPELEGKVIARIKALDFGAKDVDVTTVSWPLDFFPS
ncbi:AgmX/PglI C-terminal domain-containing protein [Piscinibacter terrae]|uniref:AgmX/PglI C-terminal domain-containing protein n=1 Tax=Piscinibacter terrae TaxID=2496871 RepID=UPI00105A5E38|nr:AgmX/PglI C-terminal domain-containing protein [Albitalea terrae]